MRWRCLLLGAPLAALAGSLTLGPITFEEIGRRAGVSFISDNGATSRKQQPEGLIAGVAVFDYDGDGYPDLYFVNGAHLPSLTKTGPQFKNRLYRNNGDLTFTDVTDKAGLGGAGYGMGVAVGDYDNDGRPDLYIANVNRNQLFHNNGDGTFTDVTARAGVGGGTYEGKKMWSVAAAWVDYNNDGLLDLFVSNYCVWDAANEPVCKANDQLMYCSPRHYKPLPHTLYRNNGDGTFTDVSVQTGIAKHLGRGMGVAIGDYDGDGYTDIFVANDDAPFQLFHNLGGKRFEEVALDSGVAFPDNGNVVSGMGVDFRDVFNKGLPSLWVTAIEKETFPLLVNLGGGQFADKTAMAGLASDSYEMSGWSNAIVDLDNDGWKDLVVARSNVQENIAKLAPRPYEEPMGLFRNLGTGRFQNVSATAGPDFQKPAPHKGLAVGDLDNDGRMDVVVSLLNGQAQIFHNTTRNGNDWIALQLRGTRSNRMGIGARIKLTAADGLTQYNHVTTSTGYACSSDVRVHFGLGAASSAREIEILWPSRIRQVLRDVAGDRVVQVTEPASASEQHQTAIGSGLR
ncbi:MAG TPA: CRTAC1 family protein [Bryobacteraceae bacterium]|nr:CRTAC1 family protein [Bryobacteraceae bacterium]